MSIESHRSALLLIAHAQLARQKRADIDASDLVHNTLLEAHRDKNQFAGKSEDELFAWLRRILHHNFLDAYEKAHAGKRNVSRKALEADLTRSFGGLDDLIAASQTSPSECAMRSEELIQLADAIEKLPDQQRQAVLLKHIVGLTLKEIAERLECTPAATAGLLFRGRQRLQELLTGE